MTASVTTRARGRPKTFDRNRVLDVTIDSYWRDGVCPTSVNEICRRANSSKPSLYREFGNEDRLMDAALTRYSETVLGPVLAKLTDDRPFGETLNALIDFATRDESPDMPSGCLFAKRRSVRSRLGPLTGNHIDQFRGDAIAAYGAWLEERANQGELTLPAPIDTIATYVDAQLTMLLTRVSAGEDPELVRAHAHLAFVVLTKPMSTSQ